MTAVIIIKAILSVTHESSDKHPQNLPVHERSFHMETNTDQYPSFLWDLIEHWTGWWMFTCGQYCLRGIPQSWQVSHTLGRYFHLILKPTVAVDWDVERYSLHITSKQTGRNEAVERLLSTRFPPAYPAKSMKHVFRPAVLVDRHERVMVWYLPDALFRRREVNDTFDFEIGNSLNKEETNPKLSSVA